MNTYRYCAKLLSMCAAAAALMSLCSLSAHAYEVTKTTGGLDVKMMNTPPGMTYVVNTAHAPTGTLPALQNAINTWTNVAPSNLAFKYGGTTTNTNWGVYDGQNVVTFATNPGLSLGTLAVNGFFYNDSTGELKESDIIFNIAQSWNTTGGLAYYDVQDIATHELGHSLSLIDLYTLADSEKTMYGYGAPGETKKRTLDPDDIAGITYLYPLYPTELGVEVAQDALNVTLNVTLTRSNTADAVSGRTVYVYEGATLKASGLTDATGFLTRTFAGTAGTHTFTVKFNGDSIYAAATPSANVVAMGKTVLDAPANGAVVTSATPTLSWLAVPGVQKYHVQVATATTFALPLVYDSDTPDTGTSVTLPALTVGKTYYWRVKAVFSTGGAPYSDYRKMTYKYGTFLAATNIWQDGVNVTLTAQLTNESGNLSGRTISYYEGATVVASAVTNAAGVAVKTFASTYAPHFFVAKYAGDALNNSASYTLPEVTIPKLYLLSPLAGAVLPDTAATLTWHECNCATDYNVQVATASTFATSTLVVNTNTGDKITSYDVAALKQGTTYYWRARSTWAGGYGIFSDTRSFVYKTGTSIAFTSMTQDGLNVTLTAKMVGGPDDHAMAGNTVSIYEGATLKASGLTDATGTLTKTFASSIGSHSFTARFAGNSKSAPSASAPQGVVIARPVLTSPVNGAIVATPAPALQWTFSGTAIRYHLQVSTSTTFGAATLIYDADTADNSTSATSPALTAGIANYWRIQAILSSGKTVYSTYFKVTYKP